MEEIRSDGKVGDVVVRRDAAVAEVDGRRRREHERPVVGLIGVGVLVVGLGGGDVDAGTPLQRREERRRHVGPYPAHHPVQLLVRQARAPVFHFAPTFRNFFFFFFICRKSFALVFSVLSLLCERDHTQRQIATRSKQGHTNVAGFT